jgi:hypothetical protein
MFVSHGVADQILPIDRCSRPLAPPIPPDVPDRLELLPAVVAGAVFRDGLPPANV